MDRQRDAQQGHIGPEHITSQLDTTEMYRTLHPTTLEYIVLKTMWNILQVRPYVRSLNDFQ